MSKQNRNGLIEHINKKLKEINLQFDAYMKMNQDEFRNKIKGICNMPLLKVKCKNLNIEFDIFWNLDKDKGGTINYKELKIPNQTLNKLNKNININFIQYLELLGGKYDKLLKTKKKTTRTSTPRTSTPRTSTPRTSGQKQQNFKLSSLPVSKYNSTRTPRKKQQQDNKKLYNGIIIKLQKLLRESKYSKNMKYLDINKIKKIDIDKKLLDLKNISDSIDGKIKSNKKYSELKNESEKLKNLNNPNSNIENADIKVFLILEYFLEKYTKLNQLFSKYLMNEFLTENMFNINKINSSNNTFELLQLLKLLDELINLKNSSDVIYKKKLTEYCDKIINLITNLRFFIINIKKDLILSTIIKIDESRLMNAKYSVENIEFSEEEIKIVSEEMEGMIKCCGITDAGKNIFKKVANKLKTKTNKINVTGYLEELPPDEKNNLYEVYSKLKENDNRNVFPDPEKIYKE